MLKNINMHVTLFSSFKKEKKKREQSCTYLAEILSLMPNVEFCASLTGSYTTFGIYELGTLNGNQYFSPELE